MTASPASFSNTVEFSQLRPVVLRKDLPQIKILLQEVFKPFLDAAGRKALQQKRPTMPPSIQLYQFQKRLHSGFVWEEDGKIVGNISLIPTHTKDRIIVANVAVQEAYRGRGIGRILLNHSLAHLKKQGIRLATLQVDSINKIAKELYYTAQFVEVGTCTTWTAGINQWREIPAIGAGHSDWGIQSRPLNQTNEWTSMIRTLRKEDGLKAYQLDIDHFTDYLNWPHPITKADYAPKSWHKLDNMMNGRRIENWGAYDQKELIGIAGIRSAWGLSHKLFIRIPDPYHEFLFQPFLSKLLHRVSYLPFRPISIDYFHGDPIANELFKRAGLSPKRTLTTMILHL